MEKAINEMSKEELDQLIEDQNEMCADEKEQPSEQIGNYIIIPVGIPKALLKKIDRYRGKGTRTYFIRRAVEIYVEALEAK